MVLIHIVIFLILDNMQILLFYSLQFLHLQLQIIVFHIHLVYYFHHINKIVEYLLFDLLNFFHFDFVFLR